MGLAKLGDFIKWELSGHGDLDGIRVSEVAMVDEDDMVYGVYTDYGQDLVPFDQCEIVNKQL